MPFKHYIITRFNVGLYGSKRWDHEQWMQHRIKLFLNITVPSITSQTCQNFTWLVLMDADTPQKYCDLINACNYKNLKLVYVKGEMNNREPVTAAVLKNIEPGNYDLITTRIDNDDAFNIRVIEKIQYWYTPRPDRWMITFPFGTFLDVRSGEIFPMQYLVNHFPTVIENSMNAKTVFFWPHHDIGVEVQEHIVSDLYWLQVIHTKNQFNHRTDRTSSTIMRDKPLEPEALKKFGLDPQKIMNMDFEASPNLDTTPS